MENVFRNIWEEYGFRGNPFNSKALSLHEDSQLPIDKAFVGRKNTEESKLLMNLLGSSGGNRIVIEGETGVGKTTFVNYYRYLAEYKAKEKQKLFTSFREIPFQEEWKAKDFLLNIISHLLHKLILVYGIEKIASVPLLEELLVLDKVYLQSSYQIEGQVLGIGGGFGKSRQVTIPQITEASLVFYIEALIQEILKWNYNGVILHFDNLELIHSNQIDKIKHIFENLRDLLQIEKVYYIFIGQTGFFRRMIAPSERVRSIFFGWPIFVPPLTENEVIEALHRRYELLAMKNVKWVKPVEDDCIAFLYRIYDGKIRFIMDAVQAIISRFPISLGRPLTLGEVQNYLFGFMEEKMLQLLTRGELELLLKAASLEKFTNAQLSSYARQDKSNLAKSLQRLQELGFISLLDKQGRNIYYAVSQEVKVLYRSKYQQVSQTPSEIVLPLYQEKIMSALKISPQTIPQIASFLQVSYTTARNELEKLLQKGVVSRQKEGKSWSYFSKEGTRNLI